VGPVHLPIQENSLAVWKQSWGNKVLTNGSGERSAVRFLREAASGRHYNALTNRSQIDHSEVCALSRFEAQVGRNIMSHSPAITVLERIAAAHHPDCWQQTLLIVGANSKAGFVVKGLDAGKDLHICETPRGC